MNAKERFTKTRHAIKRLDEIKLLIMYGCDDWQPPQVNPGKQITDPTASRAIYNVDILGDKLEALRKEERELQDFIGVSLAIINAVRDGFGEIYATLLDARYIDNASWEDIHERFNIARRTGYNLIGLALAGCSQVKQMCKRTNVLLLHAINDNMQMC